MTAAKNPVSKSATVNSTSTPLIGRGEEMSKLRAAITAERNVLLEGPVGVGKTHLAIAATKALGRPIFRIDGDSRYSEQKLSGWFDPPSVLKHGFTEKTFVAGPLVEAMRKGGVLFINELNRLPEGVQNVLLPAIDERLLVIPRLGEIRAKPGFLVVATQNPKEFVATSHLSEAILDRFELVDMDYQSEAEEREIVSAHVASSLKPADRERLLRASVRLARATRSHPRVRRGASIRAAQSVAELGSALISDGMPLPKAFGIAARMALPTRIEIERSGEGEQTLQQEIQALLNDWIDESLKDNGTDLDDSDAEGALKKKA